MRKPKLYAPGDTALMHPNLRAKIANEQPREPWKQTWEPLQPSAPRQLRAGALDFMAIPSVIAGRGEKERDR